MTDEMSGGGCPMHAGAGGAGDKPNVYGKSDLTYGDYLNNCIPTLAATAARLGSKMP